jgi:voltage-gated potassium channel
MLRPEKGHFLGVGFTAGLIALIAFAVTEGTWQHLYVIVVAVAGAVSAFYALFPTSRLFSFALANALGVYTCIFVFFRSTNFHSAGSWHVSGAYVLPILAFLAGSWWRRADVRRLLGADRPRVVRDFRHIFGWLVPVFAVGAVTFLLPDYTDEPDAHNFALVAAMAVIGAIVFAVSRNVCTFLLDTGLLFEAFFEDVARLFVPAFAFFTFYSLVVIIFASLYRVIDLYTGVDHFQVGGVVRDISFPESLYFSIVTLSTVGYGDIVPMTDAIRLIVAVEVVIGVMLLLFGFSEIFRYAQRHIHGERG